MKNLKTLSIGISAHNEEANIAHLLTQIMQQNKSEYLLKSVIVACDGCTDNTAMIATKFKKEYSIVSIINDGLRLGKAQRLNNFYKNNTSDIFLSFDADISLAHDNVINEIVKKFDNPHVGLVGGCNLPLPPKNFFEKVTYTWLAIWFDIRKNLNGGITVHNHLGCVSAVSKDLAKKIFIPNNLIPDDDFVYFTSLKLGYTFSFAKNAIVYYRTVNNLKDFLIQHGRLLRSKNYVFEHFGLWTKKMYDVPQSLKTKAVLKSLVKTPFYTILALVFQVLLREGVLVPKEKYHDGFWQPATSSKVLK